MNEKKNKILVVLTLIGSMILMSVGLIIVINYINYRPTSHLFLNLNESILDESALERTNKPVKIKNLSFNYSDNVLEIRIFVRKDVITILNFLLDNDIIIFDSVNKVIEFFVDEQLVDLSESTLLMTDQNITIDVELRSKESFSLEIFIDLEDITYIYNYRVRDVVEGRPILHVLKEMFERSNIRREGHVLAGFYDVHLNLITEETIMPSNDLQIIIRWRIVYYHITLDFNGGYIQGTSKTKVEFTVNYTLNIYEFIRNMNLYLYLVRWGGYRFVEWTLNKESFTSNYRYDFDLERNFTLVAIWEEAERGSITIVGGASMFLNENTLGNITISNDMIITELLGTNVVSTLINFLEAINGITGLPIVNLENFAVRIFNGHAVRVMNDRQIIGFSVNGSNINFLHDPNFLNWVLNEDNPNIVVSAIVLTNITDINSWNTTEVTLNNPNGNLVTGVRIISRTGSVHGDIIMPTFIDGKRVISLGDGVLGSNLANINRIVLPRYLIEANRLVTSRQNVSNITIDFTNMPWLESLPEYFALSGQAGAAANRFTLMFNPISVLRIIERGSFRTGQHHAITIDIQLWDFDEITFSGYADTTWWTQRGNFGLPVDAHQILPSTVNVIFGESGNGVPGW